MAGEQKGAPKKSKMKRIAIEEHWASSEMAELARQWKAKNPQAKRNREMGAGRSEASTRREA